VTAILYALRNKALLVLKILTEPQSNKTQPIKNSDLWHTKNQKNDWIENLEA
jgi:hypothetical protein